MMKKICILFVSVLALISCQNKKEIKIDQKNSLAYAKGFTIINYDTYKKVIIHNPYKNADRKYEYLLVPKENKIPKHKDAVQIIRTPVKKIVVTSSSHIPLLELLEEEQSLVGFPNTDFISSTKTRKLVETGDVRELGKAEYLNTEVLLDVNPEIVMSFAVDKPNKSFQMIQKLGVPVLLNGDWLEETPLGRAEWIRLFGALYQKEKEADSIFNHIKKEYNAAKELAIRAKNKPTVLSGSIFQDVWYLPAGESFIAKYFEDAQTNYLWKDSKGTGSLSLNFENVFEKGQKANYWIGCSLTTSKEELVNANAHYQKFDPFINDQIYTFGKLKGAKGGLFYFELGPIQPHIILKDIIKIAHPELLPNYKPYFFSKLE
ncbi:ABC transporter substrate-binding protein [Flavicella sediminum]|uniref:ABC transporter substrate-binding protein n=1 Tax=Flavicella sediminum TaxID=2585141 RepID=UPI001FB60C8D|nr:ABC transporter substrate-binding protein [Flavicella sediminum]